MITKMFPNNSNSVTVSGGYSVAIITILIFYMLNQLVSIFGVPAIIVKHANNKKEEGWKWKNLSLSWVHALIVGTWDLSCFYFYPEVWEDLITHITPYTYYMVAVSTGYFIYDFADLIVHKQAFKMWELSLHHIAVISIFVYNLSNRTCIGYTVVALLTEVNSIFLHLRKLMQMFRLSFSGPAYRANAAVNLATFLVCRGYCLARITYGMIAERQRLAPAYLALLGGAMFVMNMINPALFLILLKNDVLRKGRRDREKAAAGDGKSGAGETRPPESNGKVE